MRSVHLVIPDLFLPKDFAAEVSAGLSLPALERLLGRGHNKILEPVSLEDMLCASFGVRHEGDAPIAAISAAYDGLVAGSWLRADPVHLRLERDRMLLMPVMDIGSGEAAALCASLNSHFAGQGMEFFAPHPQRWYVRLGELPRISTTPLSQVIGGDVRNVLPRGADAAHWHRVFNEIQMLLHAHPLNESREARGGMMVNSVWFWGAGCDTLLAKPADCGSSHQAAPVMSEEVDAESNGGGCGQNTKLQMNYDSASSDDVLTEMFASAADVPFSAWQAEWCEEENSGRQLLVWTGLRSALQRGDLTAWRGSLQDFENNYARPIWQALRSGNIASVQVDAPGADGMRRIVLARGDTRAFWRRARRLAEYSSD